MRNSFLILPIDLFHLALNNSELPIKNDIINQIEEIFETLHFKSKSKEKINGC